MRREIGVGLAAVGFTGLMVNLASEAYRAGILGPIVAILLGWLFLFALAGFALEASADNPTHLHKWASGSIITGVAAILGVWAWL